MKWRTMAPVHWFGGKGMLLSKLNPLIPLSDVYVEPYGGAGSILFSRKPVKIEVYNDLDDDLVNLFRALQIPERFRELKHRLEWTLYSRSEFTRAIEILNMGPGANPEDRAWAFFVAHNQIVSGIPEYSPGRWSKTREVRRGMPSNVSKFRSRVGNLGWWHKRLSRVQIEHLDALKVIEDWDNPDTVFYLDPPYVESTRVSGKYRQEVDENHYRALIEILLGLEGAAVLSGYDNEIYQPPQENGWERQEFEVNCNARVISSKKGQKYKRAKRTEVVWRNPRAVRMGGQQRLPV